MTETITWYWRWKEGIYWDETGYSQILCSGGGGVHKTYNDILRSIWRKTKVKQNLVTAGIYLFKANNENTRAMCEICSKLTIKTTERR